MDLMLKRRRCLVTGASAGIGAGIVEALTREGARVVLFASLKPGADGLIFDLEDAVPESGKVSARQRLVAFLAKDRCSSVYCATSFR